MGIYLGDQNSTIFMYESGLYASASGTGQWIGKVVDSNIVEDISVFRNRFQGTGDRNVGMFVDGPRKANGTISFMPQDWKFLAFALGSCVDGGSPSPYTHVISEVNSASGNAFTSGTRNPFLSFTVEKSQKSIGGAGLNFIQTAKGCVVDQLKISAKQGEEITIDVDFIAQSVAFSSGAPTAVTADTSRPYLWRDVLFDLPSGTKVNNITEMEFTIKNNFDTKHFLNGSEVIDTPQPGNREYELAITTEASSEWTKPFYDQYFKGGSTFNAIWSLNASTGSKACYITLSGCKVVDMESPNVAEGTNVQTITVEPQSVSVSVDDTIFKYNAW